MVLHRHAHARTPPPPETLSFWEGFFLHIDQVAINLPETGASDPTNAILHCRVGVPSLFPKICKGKKTATLVIACNGISPKGCECAAMQCMLSRPEIATWRT